MAFPLTEAAPPPPSTGERLQNQPLAAASLRGGQQSAFMLSSAGLWWRSRTEWPPAKNNVAALFRVLR